LGIILTEKYLFLKPESYALAPFLTTMSDTISWGLLEVLNFCRSPFVSWAAVQFVKLKRGHGEIERR